MSIVEYNKCKEKRVEPVCPHEEFPEMVRLDHFQPEKTLEVSHKSKSQIIQQIILSTMVNFQQRYL